MSILIISHMLYNPNNIKNEIHPQHHNNYYIQTEQTLHLLESKESIGLFISSQSQNTQKQIFVYLIEIKYQTSQHKHEIKNKDLLQRRL